MQKEIKEIFCKYKPLILGIIICSLSLAILSPYMASKHEVYRDIILENVGVNGTNKSGEIFSFWVSMLLGIIAIIVSIKVLNSKGVSNKTNKQTLKFDLIGFGVFVFPIFSLLIIKQEINFFYLLLGIVYNLFYVFIKNKNIKRNKILILIIVIYFFSMMIKAISDKLVKSHEIVSQDGIYLITIFLIIVVIYFLKKENFKHINKIILILQIPLPLMMLTYFTNKYFLKDKLYIIPFSKRYMLLVLFIMICLIISNIIQYRKKKTQKENKKLVMLSTIILIFLMHYYVAPKFLHYGDFWHWGEEILPWHQLVTQKMRLYKDFSGTSGLYGIILGFFQNIIFHGTDISYLPSLAVTNIFWMLLVGIFCYFLIKDDFILVIALVISLTQYDRAHMLMLSLIILINNGLINKRIQWLQSYILLSILSVFYYPINGVAVILGAGPFACVQLYLICKEKINYKVLYSKLFWGLNIALIYPIVWTVKYGIGLVRMIFLLSSQARLADGIVAYGHSSSPEWFMRFIIDQNFRDKLWYIFLYTVIISVVLLFIYFFTLYMIQEKKLLEKVKRPEFLMLSFGCIAIPINYTLTTLRMDSTYLFARTINIIVIFIILDLLIYLYNYGDKILSRNSRIIGISICMIIAIIVQEKATFQKEYMISFGNEIKNINNSYKIEEMKYINGEQEGIPRLGAGFMKEDSIEILKTYKNMIEKTVKENERFWPLTARETLSIFNYKTPTKIDSPYLTKSLKATRENLNSMIEKPIFITNIWNYGTYYSFRWIIDNGYIMHKENNLEFWIRPDRYQEVYGDIENAQKKMLDEYPAQDLSKIPYSLGNSMKTLNKIFINKKEINLNKLKIETNQIENLGNGRLKILDDKDPFIILNLSEVIKGKDYDFLYVEIKSNYKKDKERRVQIFWESEKLGVSENRSIWFIDKNGKLLIPMGMHPAWTFSNIIKIRIDFNEVVPETEIQINKIELMKLDINRKED